jgi:hypothetical protein
MVLAGSPFMAWSCRRELSPEVVGEWASDFPAAGLLDAARRIGERHLATAASDPQGAARLSARATDIIRRASDRSAAVADLREAVRRDFASNQTRQLDGWVLSETELSVCVLLARPSAGASAG